MSERSNYQRRPNFIRCIRDGEKKTSLCGRKLTFEFAFENPEHARLNEEAGGRLVTCEDCAGAEVFYLTEKNK